MGLFRDLFGGSTGTHEDGSTTERFTDGTSVTRAANGITREYTEHDTAFPLGIGEMITTTYDGDGRVINVQSGWGKH